MNKYILFYLFIIPYELRLYILPKLPIYIPPLAPRDYQIIPKRMYGNSQKAFGVDVSSYIVVFELKC